MTSSYSPGELLSLCNVNAFDCGVDRLGQCVEQILALLVVEKDHRQLIISLRSILRSYGNISIGTTLDHLCRVSTIGPELEGARDGIDALAYHLSNGTCQDSKEVLQKVQDRLRQIDENAGAILKDCFKKASSK